MKWSLNLSMAGEKEHGLLYRSEINGIGVQMEMVTPKRRNGTFGKQKIVFFIDGVKDKYLTEAQLIAACKALNETH